MRRWLAVWGPRLFGLLLLLVLLLQVDLRRLVEIVQQVRLPLGVLALALLLPLIALKTLRWQAILRAQAVELQFWPALLAYFGSLFIGLLTPGRLGEFVKALHVSRDCNAPLSHAVSSVFMDRLFDLYLLLVVGSAALLALAPGSAAITALLASLALFTLPIILLLNDGLFARLEQASWLMAQPNTRLGRATAWLLEMRRAMLMLSWPVLLWSATLTILAYGVFFGQCFLLARALNLPLSFVDTSYAVALGSLVTLIPISISGLGTREAAMIAYLSTLGLAAEAALGFSLLVFLTFYLGSGLIGALAWWLKPVPIGHLRETKEPV